MPTYAFNSATDLENIQLTEGVVASVANRPHQRLWENTLFNKERWDEWISNPTFNGDATFNGSVSIGENLEVAGWIKSGGSVEVGTDLLVNGNLTVQGDTTSVNVADMQIEDNIIILNKGETAAGVSLNEAGIEIDRGTLDNSQFIYDESSDRWKLMTGASLTDLEINKLYAQGLATFNGDAIFNGDITTSGAIDFTNGFDGAALTRFYGTKVLNWTEDNAGAGGNYSVLVDTSGADDGGMVIRTGDTDNDEKGLAFYNYNNESVLEITGTQGDIKMKEASNLYKTSGGIEYLLIDDEGKINRPTYNDLAEWFPKEENCEPGDVLIWNKEGIRPSYREKDKRVVGIYSDSYGIILGAEEENKEEKLQKYAPVGMAGRVKVKVVGPVEVMDQLETSNVKGHAQKSKEEKSGTVLGKALESVGEGERKRIWAFIFNA